MADLLFSGLISANPLTVPVEDTAQIKKIKQSAQEFEAVLLRQMLKEIRSSAITDPNKSSNSTYVQMADEQLANLMAAQGGFGFGKAMADQMLKQVKAAQLINSGINAVNHK
jgi:Rod binding domain-containing protein